MNIYIVYDKKTGEVVHTASYYELGNDDPVAAPESDVLALAHHESGRKLSELAVARAPETFDPSDRTKTLSVNPAKGVCSVTDRKPKTGKKAK
ncbi:hypothetical protein ESZ53_07605 [Salinibacterium sp. UTAS2018]|uniref:hypothetical protein n=1 Tax=Salinibacterium sp. UTAS2018 TaxID=2508880 RepID=UPI001009411F|nr:hypothetical protein [Salinibacterium sp. UTAS2018]QAV70319.1 hypothetical protein ESZ53_07605 [Salinibacterium sp. UTAS2018]